MTTVTDDYSPIYQGDTGAPFDATFQHADGTSVSLTGATITMKMQGVSATESGTVITCAGTWTITSASTGEASYAYTSTDVGTVGLWAMYITITIAGKPIHADIKYLQILPIPA